MVFWDRTQLWVGYRRDYDTANHQIGLLGLVIAWEADRRYTWRMFRKEHPIYARYLNNKHRRKLSRMSHAELWDFFDLTNSFANPVPRCRHCGTKYRDVFERMLAPRCCERSVG